MTTRRWLTLSDSAGLDVGVELGRVAADDATVSDSAELEVQTAEVPPARGGLGDVASVQDGAALVVRDAEGIIKNQETVK